MPLAITRRMFVAGAIALPSIQTRAAARDKAAPHARIAAIEAKTGGRLGVAVLDTRGQRRIGYRAGELFPLTSTFKFLAASAVLDRIDSGAARLDSIIHYSQTDVLAYAPVTKSHVASGMTLSDLCAAAIELSDNTAGNLLLREIGGPAGLTRYARSLSDDKTRLDRTEPTLNTAIPGDLRDTTTPNAMLHDMQAILIGKALQPSSRQHIETWMRNCKTGRSRLRAGLPASWQAGDKTGSGDNGTANTIAILRPPGRAPILAAVYCTAAKATPKDVDAAHAEVARVIVETF